MAVQNGLLQRFEQKANIKKSYNSKRVFGKIQLFRILHFTANVCQLKPYLEPFFLLHKSPF